MSVQRLLLLASVVFATACGSNYESLEISRVSGASNASIGSERFVVPEGRVLVIEVRPLAGRQRKDHDVTDTLELRSVDPSIANVRPGIRADTWLFLGTKSGRTEFEVRVNGNVEEAIAIDVTDPNEEG